MAKISKAAKRYVKAYFDLAQGAGQLEDVAKDMKLIRETLKQNKDLYRFLKQPVISNKEKASVIQKIFHGKVHELTERLLSLLTDKNRIDVLPDISAYFEDFYKKHMGIVDVIITSAGPVTEELKKEFTKKVKAITGKEQVDLHFKTDPSIIGGYILQIGDLKIDDSIKGKLEKIKSNLITN